MPSVLISGASVAGPCLAYWLARHGFDVEVVERCAALRSGGQPVDIRGVALEVVERMGLRAEVEARRTRILGANVLDPNGEEIARHADRSLSAGRHDSGDVEILRDDLADLLHAATRPAVDYRFGDVVAALEDDGSRVAVTFGSGVRRTYDLVIGADGIHSGVRRLAFGPSERFLRFLGAYVGIFTVENFLHLVDWQTAIGDESLGILVCPARANRELRVFMMFESDALPGDLSVAEQKAQFAKRLGHFGWEAPRLLARLETASDLYFGEIAQACMPAWSHGRIALVGDAACAPSPRSGQGTSLALVGAYVLAAELARFGRDVTAAFAAYETRMRPFVDVNQALGRRPADDQPSDAEVDHAKNAIALPPAGG